MSQLKYNDLKRYKPVTPGQRFRVVSSRESLYKGKPEKSLTKNLEKHGGRNNLGRITSRRKGGGGKRKYRIISTDLPQGRYDVLNIQYDPNRTSRIALVSPENNIDKKYYILAPIGLKSKDKVSHYLKEDFSNGSRMHLSDIPIGKEIYDISNRPFGKGVYVKSAGVRAVLVDHISGKARVMLKSKELIELPGNCSASIGVVSNPDHKNINRGKAGINRHRGIRPVVRGVVKNPVDHPHGGGEGKTSGGRHPVTPWGKPTKGYRTSKYKKNRDHIIKSRHKK